MRRETLQSARAVAEVQYDVDEQLTETLASDEEFAVTAHLLERTTIYIDAAEQRGHDDAFGPLVEARDASERALDAHYDRIIDGEGVYETREARS